MTGSEIQRRVYQRLDDDPNAPAGVTPAEVLHAINFGQELAAMLTLCFETTAALTLPTGSPFIDLRALFPDYLVPLALRVDGRRIQPATLADLDAIDPTWQSSAEAPSRYAALGFNLLAFTGQGTTDTAAQFTYARTPARVVLDQALELDDEYQPELVNFALWWISLKEGAQGLARGIGFLRSYLEAMKALAGYVRARSRLARYDVLPFELQLADRRNKLK